MACCCGPPWLPLRIEQPPLPVKVAEPQGIFPCEHWAPACTGHPHILWCHRVPSVWLFPECGKSGPASRPRCTREEPTSGLACSTQSPGPARHCCGGIAGGLVWMWLAMNVWQLGGHGFLYPQRALAQGYPPPTPNLHPPRATVRRHTSVQHTRVSETESTFLYPPPGAFHVARLLCGCC